jgi:hypothetical protein
MKKAISWRELVSKTAEKQKKAGMSVDFKKVLDDAGKEWKVIKSGKHDEYMVAAAGTKKAASSSEKKEKKTKSKKSLKNKKVKAQCDDSILEKLCKSCKGKVEKLMSGGKQSGGHMAALSPSDYKKIESM